MNDTNTTKKGNLFEKKVFDIIQRMLENEEFFLPGKRSEIFLKKPYYSEQKKGFVIVDISIETFLPNSDKYSILTIIECKDYNSRVPINDIREFSSILTELGAHKTVGFVISNSPYQKGAYNIAVSSGIGLGIINGKNELDWISHRVDRKYQQYNTDTINTFLSTNNSQNNFFAYYEKECFESLPELLIKIGVIDSYIVKQEFINIPYKTEEEITEIANQFSLNIYHDDKLNVQDLCKILIDNYKVGFNFNSSLEIFNHNQILGKISFNPLVIFITKELEKEDNRWRFTFAHEVGHLLLHSKILSEYLNENIDSENTIFYNHELSHRINKRMEFQANLFASYLLLPEFPLRRLVNKYFEDIRNYKGRLYLDSQPVNQQQVFRLLGEIKYKFGVSKEAAKNRLISLSLLEDSTDYSLKSIIKSLGN